MKEILFLLLAFMLSGGISLVTAADLPPGNKPGEGETPTFEPVIVTAPRISSAIEEVPAAVTVVEKDQIQLGQPTTTLEESLLGVPGVFVQNQFNFAQDLRISIRGFGARSAFGIRGIQIYVDGLPYTLPDGQSQIDAIDPSNIQRIEVMRGPSSALYGNASGGVINILTEDGPKQPFLEHRTVVGEFGLWKALIKGGGQTGGVNYFFDLSHVQSDGFRDHNRAESWKFNGKVRADLSGTSDLTLIANGVYSPELQDPGGLTLEQMNANPRQASPLARQYDTYEEVKDGRLGMIYRKTLPARQNAEAVAYYDHRYLDNSTPFRFVKLDREVLGGRFKYDVATDLFGFPQQSFAGIDLAQQRDDRRNWNNISGSPAGPLILNQGEQVTGLGLYLQHEMKFTEKWSAVVGGRYDYIRFEVDDRLAADGNDTGSKTFDQATGRFGLSYTPLPRVQLYASVSQSFETPTTTELVNRPEGGGGINPNLKPQKAVNYEIGMKGLAGNRFSYEAALFYIDVRDELIAFRDFTDRVFYRNAGVPSHRSGTGGGLAAYGQPQIPPGIQLPGSGERTEFPSGSYLNSASR